MVYSSQCNRGYNALYNNYDEDGYIVLVLINDINNTEPPNKGSVLFYLTDDYLFWGNITTTTRKAAPQCIAMSEMRHNTV